MKRKIARVLSFVLLLQTIISGNFNIMYAISLEGSGTVNEPYQISTKAELAELSELSNDTATSESLASKYYILTNDIDMSGEEFDGLFGSSNFKGVFDGKGHVVKNITIDAGTQQKPRGFISNAEGATIKNLGIEDSTVRGNAVGALLGKDDGGNSTIENCYAKNVTLDYVSSAGRTQMGGLIGYANNSTISNCYTRNITNATAGMVARGPVTINNSYTDASAIHKTESDATKSNVYAVSEADDVAASTLGIAFDSDKYSINDGFPVLKWQNGEDTPPTEPGNPPTEEPDPNDPPAEPENPFSGSGTEADPYLINTATDLETLSTLSNTAINGVFLQYNDKHYKLTADIDMTGKVFDGLSCTVQGTPNNGGAGLNGDNGEVYFSGTFDGDGHVVKNLTIDSGSIGRYRGFISYADGATIKNLGIENSIIRGKNAGGFIGWDKGGNSTIENCYIKNSTFGNGSSVAGTANAGALIAHAGENEAKATVINNCYAVGNQKESSVAYFSHMVNGVDITSYIKFTNSYTDGDAPTQGAVTQVEGSGNTHRYANTTAPTADTLGAGFVADTNNKNNGLPILTWQIDSEPENPPTEEPDPNDPPAEPENPFSGSGTEADPYLINTATDLETLSTLSNTAINGVFLQYNDKHYKLTADIDMTGKVFDGLSCTVQGTPNNGGAGLNGDNGEVYFSGTFDGDGHVIKNLTIDSESIGRYRGFISYASGATVKNLGLENATIRGKDAGGFIGWDKGGNSTIENCYIKNSTFGNGSSVAGTANAGALIARAGENEAKATVINNCYAVGNQKESSVAYFSHMVNGVDITSYIKFTNSYTDGDAPTQGAVTQVEGSGNTHRYANTTAPTADTLGAGFAADTNNKNNGLPILTWQIDSEPENPPTEPDNPSVTPDPDSNSPFSSKKGNGSKEFPYEITTADDLVLLNELSNKQSSSSNWNTKHYILADDIDMTGKRFDGLFCQVQGVPDFNNGVTVTVAAFEGVFDGNGHVISNLNIDAGELTRSRGFISYTKNATIKNLGIENSTITGTGIGAIVGNDNDGGTTIDGCYAKNVTLINNLGYDQKIQGGIIGRANNTTITNCYSVSITGATAGICGDVLENSIATIKSSYTTHSLVGSNNGKGTLAEENTYAILINAQITADSIGDAFEDDINGFNDKLPVLKWENDRYKFLDNTVLTDLSAQISSGTASGSFTVGNYSKEKDSPVSIVVAVYGEDNFMIKLQAFSPDVLQGKEKKEYNFAIDGVEDAKEIKVYAWDSFESFIPYGIYDLITN